MPFICAFPRPFEPAATGTDARGQPINVHFTQAWIQVFRVLRCRTGHGSGVTSPTLGIPGEIRIWGGTLATIPEEWLFCDGASISRSTYAALFDAIGTTWGSLGPTVFNLPDFVGWDTGANLR